MKRTHPKYKSRRQRHALKKTKTQKYRPCKGPNSKEHIVENFLEVLNDIKIYHWNTRSYSQHKASDELYERLQTNIDKFVEVLLGKREDRLEKLGHNLHLSSKKSIKHTVYEFRNYLIQMDKCLSDTDLLNIRDEILADINQFLYLLTLK